MRARPAWAFHGSGVSATRTLMYPVVPVSGVPEDGSATRVSRVPMYPASRSQASRTRSAGLLIRQVAPAAQVARPLHCGTRTAPCRLRLGLDLHPLGWQQPEQEPPDTPLLQCHADRHLPASGVARSCQETIVFTQ